MSVLGCVSEACRDSRDDRRSGVVGRDGGHTGPLLLPMLLLLLLLVAIRWWWWWWWWGVWVGFCLLMIIGLLGVMVRYADICKYLSNSTAASGPPNAGYEKEESNYKKG